METGNRRTGDRKEKKGTGGGEAKARIEAFPHHSLPAVVFPRLLSPSLPSPLALSFPVSCLRVSRLRSPSTLSE